MSICILQTRASETHIQNHFSKDDIFYKLCGDLKYVYWIITNDNYYTGR